MQPLQERTRLNDSRSDHFDVRVIDQQGILLLHCQSGRGFSTDDRAAFASQVGEFTHIALRQLTGHIEFSGGNHRHSGSDLARRDVNRNAIVP